MWEYLCCILVFILSLFIAFSVSHWTVNFKYRLGLVYWAFLKHFKLSLSKLSIKLTDSWKFFDDLSLNFNDVRDWAHDMESSQDWSLVRRWRHRLVVERVLLWKRWRRRGNRRRRSDREAVLTLSNSACAGARAPHPVFCCSLPVYCRYSLLWFGVACWGQVVARPNRLLPFWPSSDFLSSVCDSRNILDSCLELVSTEVVERPSEADMFRLVPPSSATNANLSSFCHKTS